MKSRFIVIKAKYLYFSLIIFLLIFSFPIFFKNTISVFNNDSFLCKTVLIDAGHGGIDSGAVSNNIFEKNINLEISQSLKKALSKRIMKVNMTRDDDISLEKKSFLNSDRYRRDLNARKEMINRRENDAFISIHTNSNKNAPNARGILIFYKKGCNESQKLAQGIANSIDTYIFKDYLNIDLKTKIDDGDFYVLNASKIPGVLIEVGFINNKVERNLLLDKNYQNELSKSISEGMVSYLKNKKHNIFSILGS